jgi:hypothetical protein
LQLKVQLASLRERVAVAKTEAEDALSDSVKRRRLTQTMQAASIRQLISEWSDLLENNGAAEIAVAKLQAEIARLVRHKQVPANLWDEINKLVAVDLEPN